MKVKKTPKKIVAKKPADKKIMAVLTPVKPAPLPAAATHESPRKISWHLVLYWAIIVLFIGATGFIIGMNVRAPKTGNNVIEISGDLTDAQRTDLAKTYLVTGRDKLLSGDTAGAISDFSAAIAYSPNSSAAYTLRGEALMQNSNLAESINDLNRAIELDNANLDALYDRALLFIKNDDLNAALIDLNQVVALYSGGTDSILAPADLFGKRAQVNLWLKNWIDAASDFTMALAAAGATADDSLFSGRAEAYTALADYNSAIADYLSAVTAISQEIQLAENMIEKETLTMSAIAYFERSAALYVTAGDMDAARRDLESAKTLAVVLGNTEVADRLQTLIDGM